MTAHEHAQYAIEGSSDPEAVVEFADELIAIAQQELRKGKTDEEVQAFLAQIIERGL